METGIQKTQHSGTLQVSLENKKQEICKILFHINQVIAYPKSDQELEDWAASLLTFNPELDPRKLAFLIDRFKLGEIEWQKDVGIQNITMNLRRIRATTVGFRLSNSQINY